MKCTLVIGPQCSGKSTAAKKLAEQFPKDEVCFIDGSGSFSSIDFRHRIQFQVRPNCRMIVVEEIDDPVRLNIWLHIARNESMMSNVLSMPAKRIAPEFVLVFQSNLPPEEVLTGEQLKFIETSHLLPEPKDGAYCE